MKNIYIALGITMSIVFSVNLRAQTKDTEAADKLYQRFEYVSASKAYLDLVGKGKDRKSVV